MKMATHIWEQHVAAARQQNLSTSAYAKKHGLAASTFYYWQRKSQHESQRKSRSATNERITTVQPKPAKRSSKFVALHVTDTAPARMATSQRPTNYTLILTSGMRLEMSALPDPQWLAALGRCTEGAH